jgi:hypothetical protein
MKLNRISKASTISEAIRKFFATCGDLIDGAFLGALMITGVLAIALVFVFTAVFPVREAQDKPTPALHFTEQAWKTTSSDNQQGWKIYAAPTPALAQKASTLNVYDQTQTSGNQGLQILAQKASTPVVYDATQASSGNAGFQIVPYSPEYKLTLNHLTVDGKEILMTDEVRKALNELVNGLNRYPLCGSPTLPDTFKMTDASFSVHWYGVAKWYGEEK